MMRKKLLCILCSVMLVLTACGSEGEAPSKGKKREAAEKKQVTLTDTPTPTQVVENTPTPTAEPEYTVIRMLCTAVKTDSTRYSYEVAIEELQKRHPEIHFEWDAKDLYDYKEIIKASLPFMDEEGAPDIFISYAGELFQTVVNSDTAYCLENIYPEYRDVLPRKFCKNMTRDGVLYGIPLNFNAVLMYTNMDVLGKVGYDSVPQTVSEWLECCERLKAAGIVPLGCAGREAWCISEVFEPILLQTLGAGELNKRFAGEASWDDPAVANAVDLLQQMIAKGYIDPNTNNMSNDEVKEEFYDGRYAFYINGSWNTADMAAQLGADKVRISAFPALDPQNAPSKVFIGGPTEGITVNARSKNPELSAKLAFELAQLISKYEYLDGCGYTPFTVDYADSNLNEITQRAERLFTDSEDMVLFGDALMRSDDVNPYLMGLLKVYEGLINGKGFTDYMKTNVR